jgi:hypothetical protein
MPFRFLFVSRYTYIYIHIGVHHGTTHFDENRNDPQGLNQVSGLSPVCHAEGWADGWRRKWPLFWI